jgi:hypothetical protein
MDSVFKHLEVLGLAHISHVNGSFLDHLHGVHDLLKAWGNREALCHAGLFHSIYGTTGFPQSVMATTERDRVAEIIGQEAEGIVYMFCACDRTFFHSGLARETNPEYRDRFTDTRRRLDAAELRDFCELTIADRLDIVAGQNGANSGKGDESVYTRLRRLQPNLSKGAQEAFRRSFWEFESSVVSDVDASALIA